MRRASALTLSKGGLAHAMGIDLEIKNMPTIPTEHGTALSRGAFQSNSRRSGRGPESKELINALSASARPETGASSPFVSGYCTPGRDFTYRHCLVPVTAFEAGPLGSL